MTPGHPDASSGGGLSAASSSSTDAIIGGGAIRHDIIIGDSCPPSGNVPRTTDFNADGVLDWDYGVNKNVGNGLMVNVLGMSNGSYEPGYRAVVGRDANGDGILEKSEIIGSIGQCEFDYGQNQFWQEGSDGTVHWINDDPRYPQRQTNKGYKNRYHYIYNPATGILKVYNDPDGDGPLHGTLVYSGLPSGYARWYGGVIR